MLCELADQIPDDPYCDENMEGEEGGNKSNDDDEEEEEDW